MERKSIRMSSLLLWSLVAALVSQNLLIPVMSASFEDQKNYYTPDPHVGTPPSGGSTPKTPSPSHSRPSHGSSGGSYGPTPSTPKACPTPSTPSSKTPPSGHNGGYYPSPTPSTPSTPTTPTTPYTPTPTTPDTPTPTIPYTPTPSTPTPTTPPYVPDPNSPPFTCTYWRNHPQLIFGVLGWWGTLGNAFGVPTVPGLGSNISLKDALSNTRTDGYGELCRQATASLLNSMIDNRFAFTTKQVRENFIAALGSNKAAAHQASLFKLANQGNHR
ncbi:hypothetical protein L484_021408 [Morus notabilis]|uniref:Protodermal factor 1 n=1 Tax=Morus notabilis TaxID=981085 RepID=W9RHV6_9ROSA|nr:protodermal factor 1 [Morus notabilis]EXB92424.1 hypothetical protein L484_021408 [Morus notabilis]